MTTLFDHLNAIYTNQSLDYWETLDGTDRKTYSSYMINRFISMNPDYVPIVNEIQQHGTLEPRESYLFYSQLLPKGKQYHKYVKGAKDDKYPTWLVDIVAKHFLVAKYEAIEYLDIFYATDAGKADLRSILEMWAVAPKDIKKAKV